MPKTYQQGCIDVVALDDRLTTENVEEARHALSESFHARVPQLIVDLRQVRFIDSAGLECLCEWDAACRSRGGELRLAAAGRLVRDVLRVTGLDEQMGLSDDVIAAAGEFVQ